MKTYNVTITATIRKTLRVNAENEDQAEAFAHNLFYEHTDEEAYDQETNDIKEEQ